MLGSKDFLVCAVLVLVLVLGASPVAFAGGFFGDVASGLTGGVLNLNHGGAVFNAPGMPKIAPGGPSVDKVPGLTMDFGARMLDGGADVITFGKHGRDRDRARAEDAEVLAKAQLSGVENTKAATKIGLDAQHALVDQSIARWTSFCSKIDPIFDYQTQLTVFSAKVLSKTIDREAALKALGGGLQDAKNGLRIMVDNLAKSAQAENPLGDAEAWNRAITQISGEMQNSHEVVEHYLTRAILSADDKTLTDFIALISKSRDRILVLKADAKANLDSELDNKKNIEAQLAALK